MLEICYNKLELLYFGKMILIENDSCSFSKKHDEIEDLKEFAEVQL